MRCKRAAALLACGMSVAAAASVGWAATAADGRVSLERTGTQPRAGQEFVVVANVASEGERLPFSFTLQVTMPPGLELVSWRNPFQAVNCERSGATLTCRERVIGNDITMNINLTLRAAAAGSYTISAALTVDDASDPNPANNSAAHVADVLPAAAARPRSRGTAGADRLTGTAGNDRLFGLAGPDVLRGLGGHDLLDGGAGNDRLLGGGGNDRLLGGAGVNAYSAGGGNDTVRAANGRPELVACGAGADSAVLDRSDRQIGCERVTRR